MYHTYSIWANLEILHFDEFSQLHAIVFNVYSSSEFHYKSASKKVKYKFREMLTHENILRHLAENLTPTAPSTVYRYTTKHFSMWIFTSFFLFIY